MNRTANDSVGKREPGRKGVAQDRGQPCPGLDEIMVIGAAERSACEYIAELCEGLLLLEGVARLPKLGLQLMVLHALCLDYATRARRSSEATIAA